MTGNSVAWERLTCELFVFTDLAAMLPTLTSHGVLQIFERRGLACTERLSMWATRMKMAAAGRIDRARDITCEKSLHPAGTRFRQWNGGEQCLGVGMARRGKQGVFVADLNNSSEIHDRDTGGNMFHHR